MHKTLIVSLAALTVLTAPVAAQRGGAAPTPRSGSVTFAVLVSDPSGTPIGDVKVTMTGPVERTSRTEGGRLVFESLPAGTYTFRFEKDGFVPFEKEVAGRGVAPINLKVTLTALPPPPKVEAPPPVAPPPPPPLPPSDAKPVVLDMPAFIEKNYIGRASGKTTPLGCSSNGSGVLLQVNDTVASHAHSDADEFVYVVAGQGNATLGTRNESLGPGVYLLIPRGLPHAFTAGPKKPLVMISIRAGGVCAG
jgi:mannose-6-phosphate isomerase-like protein (cupin superfamily)